jgi:hypothetical protein
VFLLQDFERVTGVPQSWPEAAGKTLDVCEVLRGDPVAFTAIRKTPPGIVAQRVQHAVAHAARGAALDDHHRLVDKPAERVDHFAGRDRVTCADGPRRVEVQAPAKTDRRSNRWRSSSASRP